MEAYTIEQFILNGKLKNELDYDSISIMNIGDNGIYLSHNILNDYYDDIISDAITVTMNDDEYHRYCFKPKLLAYDIYGNPELFHIILYVNGICNMKDFYSKKIKLIKKNKLSALLSMIISREDKFIINNRVKTGV